MSDSEVVKATRDDLERCVATLQLAFANDPFFRWMLPEPNVYLDTVAGMARLITATSIGHGATHLTDGARATAVWMPPGAHADFDALNAVLQAGIADARKDEVFAMLALIRATHPTYEYSYLQFLGADPTSQGMGYGAALLEHTLQAVDEAHLPAFLLSSNPRNQSLYQRFGFRVTETVQSGSSPGVWPMLREAR